LGALREQKAVPEIQRALASDDASVFAEAARAAVLTEAPGAVRGLVMRLMTGPYVRAAARALALAGPSATGDLMAALPTTRGEGAALATADTGAPEMSGTIRAARVLARLGPEACAHVLDRFEALGYRARNAVARALGASSCAGSSVPAAVASRAMELTVAYAEELAEALPEAGPGLLRREIAHRIEESCMRVLDLASVVGDRALIARARAALARGELAQEEVPALEERITREGRDRAHALELLENVLPAGLARRVVTLLEGGEEAKEAGDEAPGDGDGQAEVDKDGQDGQDGGEAEEPRRPSVVLARFDGWLKRCWLFDEGKLAPDDPMLSVLDKVLILGGSSLFGGLSGEELYPVAEIAAHVRCAPGTVVVREGEPGDCLFVVASGTLEIHKRGSFLRTIGEGAVFGEVSLLDGAPRAATVAAMTEAELLCIPRAEFEALLDESPELSRGVIRTLLGHLRGGT
jgi:hypothetical protein